MDMKRSQYLVILVPALVALVIRIIHFFCVSDTPLVTDFVTDAGAYVRLADKIIAGEYFFKIPPLTNIGYALYLIPFVIMFEESLKAAIFVQLLLDAVSAGLLANYATKMFDYKVGIVSGFMYAFCGPIIFYNGLPLAESLSIFIVLLGVNFLYQAFSSGHKGYTFWAGVFFGLACLGRPNILITILAIGLIFVCQTIWVNRGRLPLLIIFFTGVFIVFIPFILHNRVVSHRFSPFSLSGGLVFYIGNHHGANGLPVKIEGIRMLTFWCVLDAAEVASRETGREMTLVESDAYWYKKGFDFYQKHPWEALLLNIRKILLTINANEINFNVNYDFDRRFSAAIKYLAIPSGVIFALGLLGFIFSSNNNLHTLTLKTIIVSLSLSIIIFYVTSRYRMILFPFLIILAGKFVFIFCEKVKERKIDFRAMSVMIAIVIVFGLVYMPGEWLGIVEDESRPYFRYGRYYFYKGQQEKALEYLNKAVALQPENQEYTFFRQKSLRALNESP